LVGRLLGRLQQITERARTSGERPTVACLEWLDPLMAAGNWIPEMIEMAGGDSLFGAPGEHSPWLDAKALVAANPDVLLVFPCGFPLARAFAEAPPLFQIPGFAETPAARSGSVFVADGHQLFNRPGPRLAESLEVLAEILHPEIFDFGRQAFWARA
jgi:iron complex transport system substrate-binding protein